MGGIPALRNTVSLRECLEEAYLNGPTVVNPMGEIPADEEIPLLLDKVYPCHEVVKIDVFLPGCPPSAETIWKALSGILQKCRPDLPYELLKYD
jgi:NAD-reducing hydrogenase small subunit